MKVRLRIQLSVTGIFRSKMIRSQFSNKELLKTSKYMRFEIAKIYNAMIFFTLYVIVFFNSIHILDHDPLLALIYFLAYSVAIYFVLYLFSRSFYGILNPAKTYQNYILNKIVFSGANQSLILILMSVITAILVFAIMDSNLIYTGVVFLVSFVINTLFILPNDAVYIRKVADKLDIDGDDYRILDDYIVNTLSQEQKVYLYTKREEIAGAILTNKKIEKEELKALLDKEEYVIVSMVTRQIEQFERKG